MTKTIDTTNLGVRLAAIIDLKECPAPYEPETNPLNSATVDDVKHGAGILKSADMIPALNMAAKWPTGVSFEMEADRAATRESAKADKSAKRMARARAQAQKKAEFDRIVDLDVRPDRERMTTAWRVVFPLVPTVTRIANGKRNWAARYLGSVVDDVAQVVLERMAVVLAKQDKYDLHYLIERADELGAQERRKERAPTTKEERKERKRDARARGWLMSMVNNRVQGTLVDLYTESRNLRWDNIDIITTVMASINGVGGDSLLNQHKADRAPAFLGTKFQRPDGIDPAVLATAINAGITERGLDLMVEILLNDESREHISGAFKWTKNAERVFLATPGGHGQWLWDQVCKATEHHARPKRARADAARMHVRNLFEWLPPFIVQVVDSMDPHFIGWSTTGQRAVMASDFELFYLAEPDEVRKPLVPRLQYATVEEAVAAITEAVQVLTGADLIESLVSA